MRLLIGILATLAAMVWLAGRFVDSLALQVGVTL